MKLTFLGSFYALFYHPYKYHKAFIKVSRSAEGNLKIEFVNCRITLKPIFGAGTTKGFNTVLSSELLINGVTAVVGGSVQNFDTVDGSGTCEILKNYSEISFDALDQDNKLLTYGYKTATITENTIKYGRIN